MPPNPVPFKPSSVIVTILNSVTQQPISDVRLSLFRLSSGPAPSAQATDANGRAEFNGLTPASYAINIQAPTGYTVPSSRDRVTVNEGQTVTVPPIALIPPGAIEGVVKDEDDNPMAGAEIEATSFVAGFNGFATADAAGHYRLANVRPGSLILRVRMPQGSDVHKRFPVTYYPNVSNSKQAVRLRVSAGLDLEHIDFRVRPSEGFHLRGRVALSGPTEDLQTLLIRSCDSVSGGAAVAIEEDGSFDFPDIIPGDYCLRYQELRLSDSTLTAFASVEVTVVDRDVDSIQLTPLTPRAVLGTIQLDEGATMARGLSISSLTAAIPGASPEIDSTGRFTIAALFPGKYRLRVNTNFAFGYIKSARLGAREIDPESFDYFGEPGPLTIRVAPARGIIHGKVASVGDKNLDKLLITIQSKKDVTYTVRTNGQGEFTMPGLPPGSYKVWAWETDELSLLPEFRDRFPGTTIEVKDNQQADVEVRLIPASEIERAMTTF
jgi:protocatechuate 3,4-dioxygenase beta subunit